MQELNPPPQRLSGRRPGSMEPVVSALVAVTLLVCVLVLFAWILDMPRLAGGGDARLRMQPLGALCCALIGAGILMTASPRRSMRSAARWILALPLLIAFCGLAEEFSGRSLGMDLLLLPRSLHLLPRADPARPGLLPAAGIMLLSIAGLALGSSHPLLRRLTVTFACVAFATAALSGVLAPLGISTPGPKTHHALMSIPSALAICLLSLAAIALRRQYAWPRKPETGIGSGTLQTCLLLCVSVPVLSALAHFEAARSGLASPEMIEIVQAATQVALSCGLIAWAWMRIARESGARRAINLALDAAPVSITDTEGRILRWSAGCERLYGWPSDQALGHFQPSLVGTPPLPGDGIEALLDGTRRENEVTARHRDGTEMRVLHSCQAVQPRPDIAPMVVHSMTDITARKQAELALLASDARLSLAIDLHELGIFEWSSVSDRFVFHGHAERLFRVEPGSFQGGIEDWFRHLRDTFGTTFEVPDASGTWHSERQTFRLVPLQSATRSVVEGTAHIHRGPGADDISVIGIVMDATQREQHAEMLKSRDSELRSILETVPEAMITIDQRCRIRSFSATAETLFGYGADEVLGKDVRMLLPRYVRPAPEQTSADGPSTDTHITAGHITAGLDRDGNELPVKIAIGAANIGGERIAIAFVRNMREQLATQARMGELREQFLHASRVSAMGEMGAGLAHELNQPLTATANLLGAMDLVMARENGSEQLRRMLDLARQEVLRAGAIIRRMRAFVSRGELEIRAEPLDDVITETLQLARSRSRAPGVHLHYRPGIVSPSILADRIQIQQVLVNIINNAFDALAGLSDRQPEITISTRQMHDDQVTIRVLDNGPGLPEAILGRHFEAFTSTKPNGMGLGLSISRRIVEAHGGRFSMHNVPEGGAAVEFTLPAYPDLELKAG